MQVAGGREPYGKIASAADPTNGGAGPTLNTASLDTENAKIVGYVW